MSASPSKQVVEFPIKLLRTLKKVRQKKQVEHEDFLKETGISTKTGRIVVACMNKKLNHYEGQGYSKKYSLLASQYWRNFNHYGDYFTLNAYQKNPSFALARLGDVSFEQFGLHKLVVQCIHDLGYRAPTTIQAMAIPRLLAKRNALLAAETGSGKTLAYAAPLLHNLYQQRLQSGPCMPGHPRALILAPAQELAMQLDNMVKQLAMFVELDIIKVGDIEKKSGDVVIGTPGIVKNMCDSGSLNLNLLQHVIIDEADSLLDDSFSDVVLNLLQSVQFQIQAGPSGITQPGAQLVLASATFPQDLDTILEGVIEVANLDRLMTQDLHRLMPHVMQKFVRVRRSEQVEKLLALVKKDLMHSVRVLVFVNDSRTCAWLNRFLCNNGCPSLSLHSRMSRDDRAATFEKLRSGEAKLVVATDVAARGLDTAKIAHVINYNFPKHMADYIHRVGRVGRARSFTVGHVTNLINKEDVALVQLIEATARKGRLLPDVDANIPQKVRPNASAVDELLEDESAEHNL